MHILNRCKYLFTFVFIIVVLITTFDYSVKADSSEVITLLATEEEGGITIVLVSRHNNDWDYPLCGQYLTVGNRRITFTWGMGEIKDENYSNIEGATFSNVYGNDVIISTIFIPDSFAMDVENVSIGGVQAEVSEKVELDEDVPDSSGVYSGITIDGIYSDWNGVSMSNLMEPDGDLVVNSAVVFDGDLYIYLKDSGNEAATNAGSHHNGKYSIVTDLGRTLVFQLNRDGSISGVDNASCAHYGTQWEIKIPASELPKNNGVIDFGLYLCEPTFTGVANISYKESEDVAFDGIRYDYLYGDWDGYPHAEIQYATAGTGRDVADSEAAIYFDGDIYGHVYTEMVDHVIAGGGEITNNITLRFNENDNTALYFNLVAIDAAGNINWNPQLKDLSAGTYEFYICNADAWHTSTNVDDLKGTDQIFGKAFLTVAPGRDELEWVVYSEEVCKKFGFSDTDIKIVENKYGELGNQWIVTAGISTGGVAGALVCVAVAGAASGIYAYGRKRMIWG